MLYHHHHHHHHHQHRTKPEAVPAVIRALGLIKKGLEKFINIVPGSSPGNNAHPAQSVIHQVMRRKHPLRAFVYGLISALWKETDQT